MEWKNIVDLENLKLAPGPGIEPYLGDWNRPATDMGAQKLGFNIHTIPPGQFSCPYHFHHSEEELFLILEGSAVLRQAGRFREVIKGELIFFSTGPSGAHQLYNHKETDCKILAISNCEPKDICEYPDSGKIFKREAKTILQGDLEVDYWKDEDRPEHFWPREYLRPTLLQRKL